MSRLSLMVLGPIVCLPLLVGCIDLPKESSKIRHWALSSVPGAPSVGSPVRSVAVGPVELPAYLQRLEVVRSIGLHELEVSAFDRWGAALDEQVAEILARDLSILDPGTAAATFPWPGGNPPDLRLTVVASRFEADTDGTVSLEAEWLLVRMEDGHPLAHRLASVTKEASGGSIEQVVAAMSRAVGGLAEQIVAELPAAAGG